MRTTLDNDIKRRYSERNVIYFPKHFQDEFCWLYLREIRLHIVLTVSNSPCLTMSDEQRGITGWFNFYPKDLSELAGLLSNQNLTPVQATVVAKSVHAILTANLCYTDYYKSGNFHSNCGSCTIL